MEREGDLTWQIIGLKNKSKKEMYRLLVTEANVYLLPIREANYLYIRGILTGAKKVFIFNLSSILQFIKSTNLKWTQIIQISDLSVKELFEFAKRFVDIYNYLLDYKKGRVPWRSWLINIGIKTTFYCFNQYSYWTWV